MKTANLQLETLTCPSCMQKIEGALKATQGIDHDSIKVSFNSSKVKFNFDETVLNVHDVQESIKDLGYDVLKSSVK